MPDRSHASRSHDNAKGFHSPFSSSMSVARKDSRLKMTPLDITSNRNMHSPPALLISVFPPLDPTRVAVAVARVRRSRSDLGKALVVCATRRRARRASAARSRRAARPPVLISKRAIRQAAGSSELDGRDVHEARADDVALGDVVDLGVRSSG